MDTLAHRRRRLPRFRNLKLLAAALCLGALAACTPSAADWNGQYRASLQVPGGEIPFGLEISQEGGAPVAWLINGAERIKVSEVRIAGNTIEMRMPGFENRITATRSGTALRGELFFVKAKGKNQRIPFTALRDQPVRFFPAAAGTTVTSAAQPANVTGRWAVTFTDQDGVVYDAVGEFTQTGDVVSGTFLTPTSDYRYLNGEVRDGTLYLGTFNGGRAFLFRAALGADGASMQGDYWSGLAWHESFVAHRDENATLGNATAATTLRTPTQPFTFSFPDLDGRAVSLQDARFAGKVVIVALGGSWCPNCHDEAAFLAPFYTQHHGEGLEVIGLMFEDLETAPEARAAVQRFRDRYAIGYPLLLAGLSDKADAAKRLPQLNGVFAFPTTLFIDRKGVVRHIHTGFSGPATGRHYTELTQDFDARIRALLAENS
jgi:peroxiredoxin